MGSIQSDIDDFTSFSHFSSNELTKLKDRRSENQPAGFKPVGLWFCREKSWIDWCRSAGFATGDYRYRYPIKDIKDTSQILVVDNTLESIEGFIKEYRAKIIIDEQEVDLNLIDWQKVANNYRGVYLPNPIGRFRWDLIGMPCGSVFLGLDVDSLVIFDPSIITLGEPELSNWLDEDEDKDKDKDKDEEEDESI